MFNFTFLKDPSQFRSLSECCLSCKLCGHITIITTTLLLIITEQWGKLAPSLSSSNLLTLIFPLERCIQVVRVLLTLTYHLAIGDTTWNIIHWDYAKSTGKEQLMWTDKGQNPKTKIQIQTLQVLSKVLGRLLLILFFGWLLCLQKLRPACGMSLIFQLPSNC